jgi:Aspartyl protease
MAGVTGTTDVRRVAIESLAIGEARVARLQVVAHDMDQPGIDGLLGRDFLDQFKVTIDSTIGVVTLAPK